jgi:hypothetical protein
VTGEPLVLAGIAGAGAGIVLTIFSIVRLVRLARQPELARAAVAETASVTFAEAGPVELALEGPHLTTLFRGLDFALADAAGRLVPLRKLWLRSSTSGFARVRQALYGTDVPQPGAYTVRVTGIDPARDYREVAVVFIRPAGAGIVLTIVSLLASVGLTAGGVATVAALLFTGAAPADVVQEPMRARPRSAVADARAGRALRSDSALLRGGLEVTWPVLRMRVRVPSDWVARKLSTTEIDLRDPRTPSTAFLGHVTPMPAGPTFDDYLAEHVAHAREQLEMRRIDGFATRPIGNVPGVLVLDNREDGPHTITWTGFQPAAVGSLSITLVGAAADEDYARAEPLLGAIFESISLD